MSEHQNYLDFVIEQMTPYSKIDVRKEWLANPENKKLLTKSDRWLLFAMFYISIPIYKFIVGVCIFKGILLLITQGFYTYAAKQFIIYGGGSQQRNNPISLDFNDPYLKWSDVEMAFSTGDLNCGNYKNFFFEVITNGAVVIIRSIVKRWNLLAHDHKVL